MISGCQVNDIARATVVICPHLYEDSNNRQIMDIISFMGKHQANGMPINKLFRQVLAQSLGV